MALTQQGGLRSGKADLRSLPAIVESFLRSREVARRGRKEEEQTEFDRALAGRFEARQVAKEGRDVERFELGKQSDIQRQGLAAEALEFERGQIREAGQQRQFENLLKIGQEDPSIFETSQAGDIFGGVELPVPSIARQTPESFTRGVPPGMKGTAQVGPQGRFKGGTISPQTSTEQLSGLKFESVKRIMQKREADEDTTEDLRQHQQIFGGSGQTINIGDSKNVTNALSLRREFQADVRIKNLRTATDFVDTVDTAYNRSLTSKNLGPVDIALAKGFQKLTDIQSSVREGEFATTFEGQKLINKLRGKAESLIKGGLGFTEEDRREIRDVSRLILQGHQRSFNDAFGEFTITADDLGLSKTAIFGGATPFDFGEEQQADQQGGTPQAAEQVPETPAVEPDEQLLDLSLARARRRLGSDASDEEIMTLAKKLLESEQSDENVNRK